MGGIEVTVSILDETDGQVNWKDHQKARAIGFKILSIIFSLLEPV